jgi:hypothetical protein
MKAEVLGGDDIANPAAAATQGNVANPAAAATQGYVANPAAAATQGYVANPTTAATQGYVANPTTAATQCNVANPTAATAQASNVAGANCSSRAVRNRARWRRASGEASKLQQGEGEDIQHGGGCLKCVSDI